MMVRDLPVCSIAAEIQSPHSLCEAYGEHMAGCSLSLYIPFSVFSLQGFGLVGFALMMVQNNLPLRFGH